MLLAAAAACPINAAFCCVISSMSVIARFTCSNYRLAAKADILRFAAFQVFCKNIGTIQHRADKAVADSSGNGEKLPVNVAC